MGLGAYLRTAIAQCVFYLFVVFLCILGGAIANPHFQRGDLGSQLQNFYTHFNSHDVKAAIVATSVFYACYFVARLVLIDRPPRSLNESHVTAYTVSAAFFYICFLVVSLACWYYGLFRNFALVFSVTLPCVIMFFFSVRSQRAHDHPYAHKFLPKIFYPAFSICYLSFCLGSGVGK